jgi:pimeloyl-ACP methyl ester carboxylesterase
MVVRLQTGERLHYLDWDRAVPAQVGPPEDGTAGGGRGEGHPIVLVHGATRTAWAWLPVARRLARSHPVLALDLRGHGASDAPLGGYDLDSLALDVLTVMAARGWGSAVGGPAAVVAGHGFGAMVAAHMALLEPASVAGLALVDGGWEDVAEATRMSPPELLAEIAEPPEVMASMDAYLADRRAFHPASWDADQERAARAQVDEKHAGHVGLVTKPSVVRRLVAAMYTYAPVETLAAARCGVLVMVAQPGSGDDETQRERLLAIDDVQRARTGAGLPSMTVLRFPGAGHDLMRYRPVEVAEAVAGLAGTRAGRPERH